MKDLGAWLCASLALLCGLAATTLLIVNIADGLARLEWGW